MAPSADGLLQEIPNFFTKGEAAKVTDRIQSSRPDSDSTDRKSLYEGLKKLEEAGDIDVLDGDTKLLEMLAEKTNKKEEMLETIKKFTSKLPRPEKIVGRGKDLEEILKFLSEGRVPGLNLFGKPGVGKTTIAKEVSDQMKGFVTLPIDLRGTQDINNVYFKVLEAFNLAKADYSKERIYTHLQNLTSKTLLLLDNVEQFMFKGSEADQERRSKFLEFLKAIIASAACKNGQFKVLLTSRIAIDERQFKHAQFVEYKLKAFSNTDAEEFLSRRVKDEDADNMQEEAEAAAEISRLCKNRIYLLREAEQLKRAYRSTSVQVLEKIAAQIKTRVPKKFACINALFETLPTDHLKRVAVKISLLQRPFSVSTAMKIVEMSSEFDAEWDLEMLVAQKIITAEDVNGERKYDVHECFRMFVTSYLCKEDPIFQAHFNKGKQNFAEYFSDELKKLSEKLENDFVRMFSMLEENRPNFEKTIDIIIEDASFDLLFYSDDLKKAGLISMFFKYVVDNRKRKELFKSWAENSEKKGNLLISAYIKCWEALLSAEMEGTRRGYMTLNQATSLLDQVDSKTSNEELYDMVQGIYLFSRGHLKYQECVNLTDRSPSKTKKVTKRLLHEALDDLQKSLDIHQKVYGDHSLTARSFDLIGNCYIMQFEPEKAESFYQEAMDIKLKLVGSEKHDDIVHYHNQLSQVHQMMGDNIMKGPFDLKKVMGPLLPYQRKAKMQYELAAELLIVALDLQKKLGVCDTEDTATFQRNLANLYIALKKYDEALVYAKKSYETRYHLLKEHPETVRILYLTGIIHEWRKDHKAALQSYEDAFVMEESLPEDNHSVVRKLLCDRLEAMCKKLSKKDKLKEYKPRIKAIMQIKSPVSDTQEPATGPATQVLPATGRRDDHPETAEEATEEDIHDHPVQGDIPEEIPHSYTEPGIDDTEPLIQEDLPDVPLPPDDTHGSPAEPGIAETEPPVQEDLPDVPLPPDDTHGSPTEPGIADTENPVQEDIGIPTITGIVDEISPQCHTINPEGGTLDIPIIGILLDIPRNAVSQATTVICRKYTTTSLPVRSPAGKGETVVSYLVGLEPSTAQLNKPIFINVMHSGLGKVYGYESVVKAFNEDNKVWEEPKVLGHRQLKVSAQCRKDYVRVQISKLTILAVVTRLITDRFQVTPKGCVVRSSVCDDVTIEFPEGAVDKTVEGNMKLLPMPKDIYKVFNVYACPMLFIKGFEHIGLLKSVTIQMPHPCPKGLSKDQAKLVQLKNNEWQEIEDPGIDVGDTYIKFQIQHFCWLWLVGGTLAVNLAFKMYDIYSKLPPPQAAFIAASRDDNRSGLTMWLHCLANHKQNEITDKKGYTLLDASTVDQLRPGEKAFTKIEGPFEIKGEISVTFLKNMEERFSKLVTLHRKPQNKGTKELVLTFYKIEYENPPLLKLHIEEHKIYGGTSTVGKPTIFNLNDEQKRWLVVGIGLNITLLPPLRDFLKQQMDIHYDDLKTKHNIQNQRHKKHLRKDGKQTLFYKSINNNEAKKKKTHLYDYNVKSAEDLGKLYLMPFMAKFKGFDDTCDLSAVLGILSSASIFSPDVQKFAKDVKKDVRNEWAHCKFQEWTDKKITRCFQQMKSLLQALKLPLHKEKQIMDELEEWETKGADASFSERFIEFAIVEIERLSQEVKRLEASQEEEDDKIADVIDHLKANKKENEVIVATLRRILESLVQNNKDQEETLQAMDKRITALEENQECSGKKIDDLEQKQEGSEKRIKTVEQKVKDITSGTDQEPVECFGILITEREFKDIPEDIIPLMMTYVEVYEIPGKETGQWKPEDFLRNITKHSDKSRRACLRHLLEVLQIRPTEESSSSQPDFSVSMSHVIEVLSVGKELVTTPLRENQELKEKTIEIIIRNPDYCWETFAGHLGIDEEIVKRFREDYPGDTLEVTSHILRQWIDTSDKSCTLEDIFDALRLCGYKDTGIELATYTTKECRKKLHR